MATKTKTPKKPKAEKQGFIAGMEPPSILEIDEAADAFVAVRNKWQKARGPMDERRNILEAVMKKHQLKSYEYDGKIVQFVAEEKIKVNVKKPDKAEKAETINLGAGPNGDDEDDDDGGEE